MTPTRIQEIRERCLRRYQVNGITACGRDLEALLTAWDTRDTALRSLVQQWRAQARSEHADAAATRLDQCADELARLLTSEDH